MNYQNFILMNFLSYPKLKSPNLCYLANYFLSFQIFKGFYLKFVILLKYIKFIIILYLLKNSRLNSYFLTLD